MKDRDQKILRFAGFKIAPLKGEEYLGNFYYYPDCNRIERQIDIDLNFLAEYMFPQCEYILIEKEANITEQDLETGTEALSDFPYSCEVGIKGKNGSSEDKELLKACLHAVEQAIGE